jgi:hypothetical protein
MLGPDVQLRYTSYDVDTAADQMRATGFPFVEDTIRYVVSPPSENESLAMFAPADVR